jgi:sensor histidine kinase YesM
MGIEWIAIEMMAIIVDGLAPVYFLNSRFSSKHKAAMPNVLACLCLIAWGSAGTFLEFPIPVYDGVGNVILLAYLFMSKHGSAIKKVFGIVITDGIVFSCSLSGAGLASSVMNVSVEHTLLYQDSARLLAIIVIKSLQVIVFYSLAKKRIAFRDIQWRSLVVLIFAAATVFACLQILLTTVSEISPQTNRAVVLLASGLLFVLVSILAMYEVFARQEARNIDLSVHARQVELESGYYRDLDTMLSDFRIWWHEYRNNIIALRALIESGTNEDALEYLEKMDMESLQDSQLLHTGNTVLDALVTSKMMVAKRAGIEVGIQAVCPESWGIGDNDLCAIVGNILDNAIEACERMDSEGQKRFIDFSLLVKGKNLVISIANSYDGEIKRDGDRFLTAKNGGFHGIGMQYVDSIVGKYQGHVLREYEGGVFETHVMLPLIPLQEVKEDVRNNQDHNKTLERSGDY